MEDNTPKQVILAIDDTYANIDVIKGILAEDYFVQAAPSGKMALRIIEKKKPDLILLDIMMPEMDGYEVCRQLKANPDTADIPVIFVTAKSEDSDETKGFDLGAVDYITKPVKAPILLVRVANHLRQRQMQIELEQKNDVLEEVARLRDDVEHITRHDLKTPLNMIIGAPRVIADNKFLTEQEQHLLKSIGQAGQNMLHMINSTLDMYKMESGTYPLQATSTDLIPLLQRVIEEVCTSQLAKGKKPLFCFQGKEVGEQDKLFALVEEMLCYPMFANLILNAFEASPEGATVEIDLEADDTGIAVKITNQGAVPESIRDTFFDKYVTEGKFNGTGLGTYSARLCAETQQGAIDIEVLEEDRTRIVVVLPLIK